MRVLGVMTGTSCDGLDAACIEVDSRSWDLLWSASTAYPVPLRKKVLLFQDPGTRHSSRDWLDLHRELGEWYASAIARMVRNAPVRPDLIACHGQTVAHFPAGAKGMTLQLGEPARIARATGISVACQFRDGDMAAAGQGAPLLPRFHQMIAKKLKDSGDGIAIHNLGGISNLTYISPGRNPDVIAFDTGPANIWIDAAARKATAGKRKMDAGGRIAAQGKIDMRAVNAVLRHPFFRQGVPKSTGRDDFPIEYFMDRCRARGASLVATATAISAESIARAYEQFVMKRQPLKTIYFCGGGAKNPTLLSWIQNRLPKVKITTLGEHGFDDQLIEAEGFAYFGFLAATGRPIGGAWTGVKGFGPPAHIVPGENWRELLTRLAPSIRRS